LPVARPVVFTPAAQADVVEAQAWYEAQAPGLGARFRAELDAAVQRLAANPEGFPVVLRDVRRARLRRFPYGLFYRAPPDALVVLACFHARRDPRRWQERI
jgi:plasmid stabilization system protein ParE